MHETQNNQSTTSRATPPAVTTAPRDGGFTLIELLLVVLILGILASVVVFAVGGVRAEAAETGCAADGRTLGSAAEAYFAENGSAGIPATGTGHDRYEQTLVDDGFLKDVSVNFDLDANGTETPEAGSSC